MSFIYQPDNFVSIGSFSIAVQALHLYLGFAVFLYWIYKQSKKQNIGFQKKEFFGFSLLLILFSLAGGRIYHYLYHWNGISSLYALFDLSIPGLTSFGMILGGFLGILILLRKKPFMKYADIIALATLLWIFIYRISSYPHGSVPGTETMLPWRVFAIDYFQHTGKFLHPTALYLSFAALFLFILLHWYSKRKKFDGEVAILFVVLYAASRFIIEFFRAPAGDFPSPSQSAALLLFVIGLFMYFINYCQKVRFLRNPKRSINKKGSVLCPADGRIIYVEEVKKGEVPISVKKGNKMPLKEILKMNSPQKGVLIGIYLSLFDIHYQRSPLAGKVINTYYYKTGFNYSFYKMLFRKLFDLRPWYKGSEHLGKNERNVIHIKGEHECFVVQIAEKVVNKIECYVKAQDSIKKGQQYGLIKMGSQVDLFICGASKKDISLRVGQTVRAAQTIILK